MHRGLGSAALLFLGGALTAVAVVALHALWWGLLLGLAATLAAVIALEAGWATRLPYGVGFALMVAWLAPARPEGDHLVAGDAAGYTLLTFVAVVVVLTLATLPRPGGRTVREAPPT